MTEPLAGFAFPFRIAGGRVDRAEGSEKVEHNLRHLLSTRLGERLMLRGYGGGVHHHLQEPNDTTRGAVIMSLNAPAGSLMAAWRMRSQSSGLDFM